MIAKISRDPDATMEQRQIWTGGIARTAFEDSQGYYVCGGPNGCILRENHVGMCVFTNLVSSRRMRINFYICVYHYLQLYAVLRSYDSYSCSTALSSAALHPLKLASDLIPAPLICPWLVLVSRVLPGSRSRPIRALIAAGEARHQGRRILQPRPRRWWEGRRAANHLGAPEARPLLSEGEGES